MRVATLALVVVTLASCNLGKSIGSVDGGPVDKGPIPISCTVSFGEAGSECPADIPDCNFGVCKRPCDTNDDCNNPATYCNTPAGYCQTGCRDSSTCESGTVCSAGGCVASTPCTDKCTCAAGQVCSSGSCVAAPATCTGIDQCGRGADGQPCEDLICSPFTSICYDDDPAPCTQDNDCVGRPGCEAGCTCTGNQVCVAEVACTEANEGASCGAGNYCDGDGNCQVAPACSNEGQCAPLGLTCNTATSTCQRSTPCTSSAQCTAAPATHCNPATQFCAQPLCSNGGVVCEGDAECSADGRCVSAGECAVDAECASSEYCSIVNATGTCVVGCRSNVPCPGAGQVCNGAHQCVAAGGLPLGATCAEGSPCQAGLECGQLLSKCVERCTGTDCTVEGCCPISGLPCCTVFFGVCSESGC